MTKNAELERLVSRQRLLSAARLREKEITLDGIGVVRIRELTTDQRRLYLEYLEIGDDGKPKFSQAKQVEFNKFIVGMGLINGDVKRDHEQGDLMFPDGDVPDMRFDVMDTLSKEILTLSGILHEAKNTTPNASIEKRTTSDTPSPLSLEQVLQKS